jgi:endonuclease YncB( thermonuclease family)
MRIIIVLFISLSFPLISHAEKVFGRVIEVTSGDKLTLLDTSLITYKVRLVGIDAPESSQPYSKESRAKLFSLIHGKQVVVITNKRSHSNVLIGKVLLNKKDINLLQIKHGMAWTSYNYVKEISYDDQGTYADSQLKAKNEKIGLWRDSCPIEPWVYRQKCCPKHAKH